MQASIMRWLQRVCVLAAVVIVAALLHALTQPLDAGNVLGLLTNLGVFVLLWTGARASERQDLSGLVRAIHGAAALLAVSTLLLPLVRGLWEQHLSAPAMVGIFGLSVLNLYPALGLFALAAVLQRVHELMQDEALTV